MQIDATVERILYPAAPDSGAAWYVLSTDVGKASGTMGWRPDAGQAVTLSGEWGAYKGERQFRFRSAVPNVPADPRDLLRYACTRTKGIGPALCDAIWAACGPEWRHVQAGQVPRLSVALCEALQDTARALDTEREQTQAIAWLMGHGATDTMAATAWETWKTDTVARVLANPYALTDLPHYGFAHVDTRIRPSFEIGDADPRRIRAGILYALRQATADGSTVVRWSVLARSAREYLGPHDALILAEGKALLASGALVGFADSGRVALREDYEAENIIWRFACENRSD
jgi:exodeoxyribonuclease V alpha subunit